MPAAEKSSSVTSNRWYDSFIESTLRQQLESPPTFSLAWIKRKIMLIVDCIFATLSTSYQNRRTEISNKIKKIAVNETDQQTQNPIKPINTVAAKAEIQPAQPAEKLQPANRIEASVEEKATQPDIIVSINGINQYTPIEGRKPGVSACVPLSCSFLASTDPASPQMIADLILSNTYTDDGHTYPDEYAMKFELKMIDMNPWTSQSYLGPTMQVSFEREGEHGMRAAVEALLKDASITGVLITGNNITTAIRRRDNHVEFFDSHGDDTVTHQGNGAFVKIFSLDQQEELTNFLCTKYQHIGGEDFLEMLPIVGLQ